MICLTVRFPGNTRYLYLGRGNHYEGIWEGSKIPPSEIRIRERFLEYFRKYLKGATTGKIILDELDRIVTIPYFKDGRQQYISFFYKGRSLYFLNIYYKKGWKIFLSWQLLKKDSIVIEGEIEDSVYKIIYGYFDQLGRRDVKDKEQKSEPCMSIDDYFAKEKKRYQTNKLPKRKMKYLQRKEVRIAQDLKKVKKWKELKQLIEEQNFEFISDTFCGYKFKFDKEWNHYKKLDLVYKKIKRLKMAEELLTKRIQEHKKICERAIKEQNIGGETTKIKYISPVWHTPKLKKMNGIDVKKDIVEFTFSEGTTAAVGKNVHANDYLRNVWSKKSHYWFHIEGYKSGHLIVKTDDITWFSENDFMVLGSILKDYAGLEIDMIPLIYTQVKNIKGLKGSAGSVTYKKAKFIKVKYLKIWRDYISFD
ncbi:MAG: hypothetical protein ISR65_09535 [Bacteriovoracaceae bacterium]|nr:hypothetical protein [Bacteriovoracaceae bacterium]